MWQHVSQIAPSPFWGECSLGVQMPIVQKINFVWKNFMHNWSKLTNCAEFVCKSLTEPAVQKHNLFTEIYIHKAQRMLRYIKDNVRLPLTDLYRVSHRKPSQIKVIGKLIFFTFSISKPLKRNDMKAIALEINSIYSIALTCNNKIGINVSGIFFMFQSRQLRLVSNTLNKNRFWTQNFYIFSTPHYTQFMFISTWKFPYISQLCPVATHQTENEKFFFFFWFRFWFSSKFYFIDYSLRRKYVFRLLFFNGYLMFTFTSIELNFARYYIDNSLYFMESIKNTNSSSLSTKHNRTLCTGTYVRLKMLKDDWYRDICGVQTEWLNTPFSK